MALIGVAAGIAVEALSNDDGSTEAGFIVAGLVIVVLLADSGFVAGWFGRERDDVVVAAIGAGIVAVAALAIGSLVSEDIVIGSVVLGGGIAIAGGAAGVLAWRIGDLICDGRDLPTARRLVAPAVAEDHPGGPLWTTDAGPAIRSTLDHVAGRVAADGQVDGCAVGIVVGFPRDTPVVVVLAGDSLVLQPVDINGAATSDPWLLRRADVIEASCRSVTPDGTHRPINGYDDVITIRSTGGARTRLRLPYGTRGVGAGRGGPDVIRQWLGIGAVIDRSSPSM